MPIAIAEPRHLILDRRAISRPTPLDRARPHRRSVEPGADDVMTSVVGPRDRTSELRQWCRIGCERQRPCSRIAWLWRQPRPINGPAIDSRRRPGLEPALGQAEFAYLHRQHRRRLVALPTTAPALRAAKQRGSEECPCGQHQRAACFPRSVREGDRHHAACDDLERHHFALDHRHPALRDKIGHRRLK